MREVGRFVTAKQVASNTALGQDRVGITEVDGCVLIVVADGAGGMTGGSAAAEAVVERACAAASRLASGEQDPVELLRELDRDIQATGGQSTAVIAIVGADGVSGASVGDSGALRWEVDRLVELTADQRHKPLIGSGEATPVGFRGPPLEGTLLVASDGLLKYANRSQLVHVLRNPELAAIPPLLVSLVRLRSGALPDDVAAVVCRPAQ
jgi:serine/threonine protein phosphatase PrpC